MVLSATRWHYHICLLERSLWLWCRAVVPNIFGTRNWFHGTFPGTRRWGLVAGWLKHITFIVHFFLFYYFVIYNEIIIQFTIMQNQWEPWVCFPTTRWSHLRVIRDSDTRSVLLMSGLLCNLVLVAVTPENPATQR